RGVGLVARLGKRAFSLGAVGDIAPDTLQFGRPPGIRPNETLSPGDPSGSQRAIDLLIVYSRAARLHCTVALFEDVEREPASNQRVARQSGDLAISLVSEGDVTFRVANDDQVALRFEQNAGTLFGLL